VASAAQRLEEKTDLTGEGCSLQAQRLGETYVRVAGSWNHLFCAIDSAGNPSVSRFLPIKTACGEANSNQNNSLIGATFGETYIHSFPHVVFTQTGNYIPARGNTRASSGDVDAELLFPVYHRLGLPWALSTTM
jgi:hypothetical protein